MDTRQTALTMGIRDADLASARRLGKSEEEISRKIAELKNRPAHSKKAALAVWNRWLRRHGALRPRPKAKKLRDRSGPLPQQPIRRGEPEVVEPDFELARACGISRDEVEAALVGGVGVRQINVFLNGLGPVHESKRFGRDAATNIARWETFLRNTHARRAKSRVLVARVKGTPSKHSRRVPTPATTPVVATGPRLGATAVPPQHEILVAERRLLNATIVDTTQALHVFLWGESQTHMVRLQHVPDESRSAMRARLLRALVPSAGVEHHAVVSFERAGDELMVVGASGSNQGSWNLGRVIHWMSTKRPSPAAIDPNARARRGLSLAASSTPLSWEVLPEGWWRDPSRRYGLHGNRRGRGGYLRERIEFLNTLRPREWYVGSQLGRRLYFVALFDTVAVAECPEFGNAVYCWHLEPSRSWKDVFRATKHEALSAGATRLVHSGDWEARLRSLVR